MIKMPDNITLAFSFYHNSNAIAVRALTENNEPYMTITTNLDGVGEPSPELRKFPYISIKDYSENEGIVEWLVGKGVIEKEPVAITSSGYVKIPTHKLTEKWQKTLLIVGEHANAPQLKFKV